LDPAALFFLWRAALRLAREPPLLPSCPVAVEKNAAREPPLPVVAVPSPVVAVEKFIGSSQVAAALDGFQIEVAAGHDAGPPEGWSSAGDMSRSREIEARGRRPRSRARVREIFCACEGSTGSAGGDFAKPRVLCINAKLGGRFAKFAQMQNSFAKPLELSFCGFLQIIKCKTDLERPLEITSFGTLQIHL